MVFRSSGILGLAIGDGEITCAQVAGTAAAARVQKLARFTFPAGASLEQPDRLGQQLRTFLREHHFSATRAVVGVPARWLIAQEKDLPPANEEQALAMLRLQAERMAVADNHELVVDAAADPDPARPTRALVIGMLQQHLDRVRQVCEAAGLTPVAVTPTALAVSSMLARGAAAATTTKGAAAGSRRLVLLSRRGAEVLWEADGAPRMLRHLNATGAPAPAVATTAADAPPTGASAGSGAIAALGGELRRALRLGPTNGTDADEVLLFNDVGLTDADVTDLAGRLGTPVRAGHTLASVGTQVELTALNGAAGRSTPDAFFPAAALAVVGAGRAARVPVDFLHTRLAPPREARVGRRAVVGTLAAVAVVALIGYGYITVRQREAEAAVLDAQLAQQAPDVKAALQRIDRANYGRGYFTTRPPVLECLREIALAFPPNDPIWTTSFNLRDNRKGQIQGKAANQQVVLSVLDRLKANPRFAEVQFQDIREAAGGAREISFSISFTFIGTATGQASTRTAATPPPSTRPERAVPR